MDVTRRALLCSLSPLAIAGGRKDKPKGGKPRGGKVALLELAVHRAGDENRIEIDGRLRNDGDRPLDGLTLMLHFLGADNDQVSQLRGKIDNEALDAGEESEFHWQLSNNPRAVEVQVTAANKQGFEVDLDKPGPYPIE
jgi:hypothetical protein